MKEEKTINTQRRLKETGNEVNKKQQSKQTGIERSS
jgi:hypothetical protein